MYFDFGDYETERGWLLSFCDSLPYMWILIADIEERIYLSYERMSPRDFQHISDKLRDEWESYFADIDAKYLEKAFKRSLSIFEGLLSKQPGKMSKQECHHWCQQLNSAVHGLTNIATALIDRMEDRGTEFITPA